MNKQLIILLRILLRIIAAYFAAKETIKPGQIDQEQFTWFMLHLIYISILAFPVEAIFKEVVHKTSFLKGGLIIASCLLIGLACFVLPMIGVNHLPGLTWISFPSWGAWIIIVESIPLIGVILIVTIFACGKI